MSILVCIVDRNKRFFIASDRRAIKNGITTNNYQKIYKFKEKIYFGMTGTAESGLEILKVINEHCHYPVSDLINLVDSIFQPNITKLTIMIAGKDENSNFFIWQKNNEGQIEKANIGLNSIAFSISSTDNIDIFNNFLSSQLKENASPRQAISRTIRFASKIDNSISKTYTIFEEN